MWREMKSSRKFISKIEGAVIGSIPISAFKQVLIYDKRNEKFVFFLKIGCSTVTVLFLCVVFTR